MNLLERYIKARCQAGLYRLGEEAIAATDPEIAEIVRQLEERYLPAARTHWPYQEKLDGRCSNRTV